MRACTVTKKVLTSIKQNFIIFLGKNNKFNVYTYVILKSNILN